MRHDPRFPPTLRGASRLSRPEYLRNCIDHGPDDAACPAGSSHPLLPRGEVRAGSSGRAAPEAEDLPGGVRETAGSRYPRGRLVVRGVQVDDRLALGEYGASRLRDQSASQAAAASAFVGDDSDLPTAFVVPLQPDTSEVAALMIEGDQHLAAERPEPGRDARVALVCQRRWKPHARVGQHIWRRHVLCPAQHPGPCRACDPNRSRKRRQQGREVWHRLFQARCNGGRHADHAAPLRVHDAGHARVVPSQPGSSGSGSTTTRTASVGGHAPSQAAK